MLIGVKPDQPQISLQDGSQWGGFEIQLIEYLMDGSGARTVYSPVVTSDRSLKLVNRELDMIVATYSDTKEQEGKVLLAGPYMQTPQGVLVRKDDRRVQSSTDLKKRPVCTTKGSTSEAELEATGADVSTQERFGTCVEMLKNEQVDAVSTDLLILYGFQTTSPSLAIAKDKSDRPVEIPSTDLNRWMVGFQAGDMADCKIVLERLKLFVKGAEWSQYFNSWFGLAQQDYDDWSTRFRPDVNSLDCVGQKI